jgi:hypothetical protein
VMHRVALIITIRREFKASVQCVIALSRALGALHPLDCGFLQPYLL